MNHKELKKSINPKLIFYFTCDLINNGNELAEVINNYFDFSKDSGIDKNKYLFMDEISSVKDWEKGIKFIADSGKLENATVILTGSHAIDLKYTTERLPGRRGEGKGAVNKIMVPMKFSEYVETVEPNLKKEMNDFFILKKERRYKIIFGLFKGDIDPMLSSLFPIFQKDLKRLLDNYIITGGVIRAIESYYKQNSIDNSIYELFIRSLMGDLGKWRYQENIAKQILRSIVEKMTTRISLNSIAKENEIGSHNTVSNYLGALEDSFVLNILYQLELNIKMPFYKKERKIYINDPFIYHAIKGWVEGSIDYFRYANNSILNSTEKSRIIEMIVFNHLIRYAYNLKPSDIFSSHDWIFFWKKKRSEKEIDFIVKYKNELFPIETRYKNTVDKKDLMNLFHLKQGIVITKNKLDTYKQYSFIPVEIFLMLI